MHPFLASSRLPGLVAAALLLAAIPLAWGQRKPGPRINPTFSIREIRHLAPRVVGALGLESGDVVVAYGATDPQFLEPLAAQVGDEGRVYAVMRREDRYRRLLAEIAEGGFGGRVEPILAVDGDAHMGNGVADVVIALDLFGFFDREPDVYMQAHAALKPEGRLVQMRSVHRTQREAQSIYPGAERTPGGRAATLERNRQRLMVERFGFRFAEELSLMQSRTVRVFLRREV